MEEPRVNQFLRLRNALKRKPLSVEFWRFAQRGSTERRNLDETASKNETCEVGADSLRLCRQELLTCIEELHYCSRTPTSQICPMLMKC